MKSSHTIENSLAFISIEEMEDFLLKIDSIELMKHLSDSSLVALKLGSARYFEISQHLQIPQKVYNFFSEIKKSFIWNLYTPKWSIELPYIAPILKALANAADKIELRVFYIEEAAKKMNQGLIELSCVDSESGQLCFLKNMRPKQLVVLMERRQREGLEEEELSKNLIEWYEADNGQSIQMEILEAFKY